MSDHLVPSDQAFHDDKQLMADLTALNGQLSRYVLRQLDADAGRIGPTSVADERALADTMAALASQVRERAERRANTSDTTPTIEGEAMVQRLTRDRPSERC
jgi:hypothetical protein